MPDPTYSLLTALLADRPPSWSGVDPERVVEVFRHQGLAGLAVADDRRRASSGVGGGPMPDAVRQELESLYARWGLHSTLVLESAERATRVLAGAGVEALAFKGAALLRSGVYDDPGARLMEDADLLVRPADVPAAVDALREAGFEPWTEWHSTRLQWLPSVTLRDRAAAVDIDVDLHWDTPYGSLRSGKPDDDHLLWDGADPIAGTPAPEPHFVVLVEHFLKHLRVVAHLRGLADLSRLAPRLRSGEMILRHAGSRGSLPGVRAVLALLRDGLGADVPPGILDVVGVPPLRGRAARRLDLERLVAVRREDPARVGGLFSDWPIARGWKGSLGEVVRVAIPSDRWLRARYRDVGGRLGRRVRYLRDLWGWAWGRSASPLSPNQGPSA